MRFGDLYEIPSRNGLTKPRAIRGEGIKFINMGELFENDRIGDIEMDRAPVTEKEFVEALVEEGDLLFARQSLVREGAGKCSIVTEVKEPTTFDSHLIRVRLKRELANPNFYRFYFSSHLSPIPGIVSQCAQAGIKGNDLKELDVICPPIHQQDRIAEILSAYDELIENNRKQIKLLEEAAQRLYKEWFIDFKFPGYETTPIDPETSLPEGWKRTTIGNEFSITTGKRDANYGARDGLYPFFTCAREPIAATNYSFDTEAIILAGNGDLYSRLFRGKFEAYQRTYVIEPREKSYLFIGGKRVENEIIQLKAKAAGSTIKYLTKGMIESIEILLPSSAVLAKFNNMYEAIQSKMESLENSISLTAEVRDRLLPKLMSGEIEVS